MFLIHPTDLRRRRARCKPIVDSLSTLEHQTVVQCNVCESESSVIISNQDRYGFNVRTAMCLQCGLIYVVDQFTAAGYEEFYGDGNYRRLIERFKGKEQSIERIQRSQQTYATSLANTFQGFKSIEKGGRLLDIGGSTGLVAHEFARRFSFQAIVLEPAVEEAEAARASGLETVTDAIENWNTSEQFDLILLCRTIEHVVDFNLTLRRIRQLISPDGVFYCDIAEFVEICRQEGPPFATTKIDHCYWLTQETASNIFQHYGFEIVSIQTTLPANQLGFLLRACEPQPISPISREWNDRILRQFREIEADWFLYGRHPLDGKDRLRRQMHYVKNRFAK